jgi:hypothetical protein
LGPDQEFETSGPYRQPGEPREPYGETYTDRDRNFGRYYAPSYGNPAYRADPRYRRDEWGWASAPRGGHAGRGPKGYTRPDDRIREDVCDRLSWNDEVDATDISVRVESGEVMLEGSVATRHMKRLATDIAEAVPGVLDVHNTVRVKKPVLTELKEKLTGHAHDEHFANTGTRPPTTVNGL